MSSDATVLERGVAAPAALPASLATVQTQQEPPQVTPGDAQGKAKVPPGATQSDASGELRDATDPHDNKSKSSTPNDGKQASTKVLQCRQRHYHEILPIIDKSAPEQASGMAVREVVKARNWLMKFDMRKPEQRKLYEAMIASSNFGNLYWELEPRQKGDKLSERASTLAELLEMPLPKLVTMLSPSEMEQAGVTTSSGRMEWLVAIQDHRRLSTKSPRKENK